LADWTVDLTRLQPTADFVAKVVRDRYPNGQPPFHARWRHFVFSGRDLWSDICAGHRWESPAAAARAAFDLAITSVLLDAGAGAAWRYHDSGLTGLTVARSEGLALASLRWFERGGLSDDPVRDPLRADAAALCRVDAAVVDQAFQSGPGNPLQGAHGRAALLNRLGQAVLQRPDLFASADVPRPGGLFDALLRRASELNGAPGAAGRSAASAAAGVPGSTAVSARGAFAGTIGAPVILELLLEGLGPIWPNRSVVDGVPLGDCWSFAPLQGPHSLDHFVPLHKLSQWLAYSLIEPLEAAGLRVCDVGGLTGLAEYRNGGLLVDMGVLVPRDPGAFSRVHDVSDPFVVGWRSATVALLDEIAPLVAARLGFAAEEFPLARVLEGGTWAAGRLIAREKRADGGPPFQISSDGTVF
jgi:hypothetical protein